MKKMYVAPAVEINETLVENMMALSIQKEPADASEILNKKEAEWDMWTEPWEK